MADFLSVLLDVAFALFPVIAGGVVVLALLALLLLVRKWRFEKRVAQARQRRREYEHFDRHFPGGRGSRDGDEYDREVF